MTKTHYGIGMSKPEAHITRSKEKNRGRVKIYSQNTIYLEKEEEFEIEIFNPTQDSILAKIEINGTLISNTGLVLKPAQRVFLERYFDVDRKFKFDVYEVENWEKLKKESQEILKNHDTLKKELTLREQLLSLVSSESEKKELESKINDLKSQTEEMNSLAKELNHRSSSVEQATKYNGTIKIHFYKQHQPITLLNSNITWTNSGFNYNNSRNIGGVFGTTTSNILGGSHTLTSNIGSSLDITGNTYFSNDDSMSFSCCDNNISEKSFSKDLLSDEVKEMKDEKMTGRIEQGSISNQKFETVNMIFDTYSFHTVEYKLLPSSEKPLEMKDLRKYCSQCGKKLSPSDNFCSSCGKKS